MADNYNYLADARRLWPKADIEGQGPHVAFVMNFDGSLWIRLYQTFGEAKTVSEMNSGQYLRLKPQSTPFRPVVSEIGYREKRATA